MGLIYLELKDARNAIFNLSYANAIEPANQSIQVALANAFIEEGALEKALELLRTMTNKHCEYASAYAVLGMAFNANHEFEEAIIAFDRVLDIEPDYYQAWNGKSKAFVELGGRRSDVSFTPICKIARVGYQNGIKSRGCPR